MSKIPKSEKSYLSKIINSIKIPYTSEEYHKICLNINDCLNREYNTNLDEILNSDKFVLMTEKDIIKSFASKIYDKKLGNHQNPITYSDVRMIIVMVSLTIISNASFVVANNVIDVQS